MAESKVCRKEVKNLEELDKEINELKEKNSSEPIYVWFVGAVEDGKSWCSDCVKAEPAIEKFLTEAKFKTHCSVIVCPVDKASFKTSDSPYMKHKVKVAKVPTLLAWGDMNKLEESDCMNEDLLVLLFEDVIEQ